MFLYLIQNNFLHYEYMTITCKALMTMDLTERETKSLWSSGTHNKYRTGGKSQVSTGARLGCGNKHWALMFIIHKCHVYNIHTFKQFWDLVGNSEWRQNEIRRDKCTSQPWLRCVALRDVRCSTVTRHLSHPCSCVCIYLLWITTSCYFLNSPSDLAETYYEVFP